MREIDCTSSGILAEEREMDSYWSHRSDSYSEMNQRELHSEKKQVWEELIFDGVDEKRPLRILDVGSGPGFFSILCALRGHIVTAADMNEEMLRQAEGNARAAGADVRFVRVGHTLPFAPGSFDMIVSRNVTWTLPRPEDTLRVWGSLLSPEGLLRYFDAEWYSYLRDTDARPEEVRLHDYSRASEMEKIAGSLPMTYRRRPDWDREYWRGEGYEINVRENLNSLVYDAEEQERYRYYPLFMVTVSNGQKTPGRKGVQEEINEHWSELSDNFNDYVVDEFKTERPEEWLRVIEACAPSIRPLRILDAGCGPGFFSVLLSRAGHDVTGIDGSERMLIHARNNAEAFGVSPKLEQGDFGRLSYPDDSFDMIVCRNVTHIIREHLKVYGEWFRVLKPGGVLLVFDANWHLPYQPGPIREEAIRRERETLAKYGRGYTHDGSYEYIDSPLEPDNYKVFGKAIRPDFDYGVLKQLPFENITFDRDVTEKLWSEKEKLAYAATPLFMLRAEKPISAR